VAGQPCVIRHHALAVNSAAGILAGAIDGKFAIAILDAHENIRARIAGRQLARAIHLYRALAFVSHVLDAIRALDKGLRLA